MFNYYDYVVSPIQDKYIYIQQPFEGVDGYYYLMDFLLILKTISNIFHGPINLTYQIAGLKFFSGEIRWLSYDLRCVILLLEDYDISHVNKDVFVLFFFVFFHYLCSNQATLFGFVCLFACLILCFFIII